MTQREAWLEGDPVGFYPIREINIYSRGFVEMEIGSDTYYVEIEKCHEGFPYVIDPDEEAPTKLNPKLVYV